jgi:hypothetical protein
LAVEDLAVVANLVLVVAVVLVVIELLCQKVQVDHLQVQSLK